tara:strand:+ start:4130 stop:10279 length:6150 start_codon:yes stop_codon:yes gene_type:complete
MEQENKQNPETELQVNDKYVKNNIDLDLGDIIEIISPQNPEYHETTNYIDYIDDKVILLTNVGSLVNYKLNRKEDGSFSDESIEQIILLNRSEEKGYARQNNLIPNTWVDVHFSGEMPIIITGQISNLEDDMIEIITYPDMDTIYIDFKYQGIPLDIPIDKFVIREKPASIKNNGSLASMKEAALSGEDINEEEEEKAEITFLETGETTINIPEQGKEEENIYDTLHNLYADANTIVFGEELGEISQLVELPENEQRYGIDIQVNDLMDELLSTIPNSQRSQKVLDNINRLIERFKQLRNGFSKFDENQNIYDKNLHSATHKPLIEKLSEMKSNLTWLVPVVANKKKIDIQDNKEDLDVANENMTVEFSKLIDMKNSYKRKGANDQSVTYDNIQNFEQETFRPFTEPLPTSNILTSKVIEENFDAVVDNLTEFYSSVYTNSGLKKQRFVIQRYNLGSKKIQETILANGKKVYKHVPSTNNDPISIKSFLMLPSSVIKFSEIRLPTTSILSRANLHDNYLMLYRLLRKNTEIQTQVIEDFSKELEYEKIQEETKKSIFAGINEFILDSDAFQEMEYMDENDRFRQFLESIIPKTRLLIRLYRKYIKNRLSFAGVVQKLEPFHIYTNDITFNQYKEIRYFVLEEMKVLKKKIANDSTKMNILKNTTYNVLQKENNLLRILSENQEFSDIFYKAYQFFDKDMKKQYTSSEIIFKLMEKDNLALYSNIISSVLLSLSANDEILSKLQEPELNELDDVENIKAKDCSKRYLAKKYFSIGDLQKDNNKSDLFFDSEYDDTQYDIINKYEKEKKEMESDMFFSFLVENLIQRHKIQQDNANELAETLIAGKKKLLDGHYAILEIHPKPSNPEEFDLLSEEEKKKLDDESNIRKKTFFYRRLKYNWIRDDEIQIESFMDTNDIFCNMAKDCVKNDKNKICETPEQAKIRIRSENKDALKEEFHKRFEFTMEEMEKNLENEINAQMIKNEKNELLNEISFLKANNIAFEIGKRVKQDDILRSPYESLRELILEQTDFTKKQNDICKFVDNFSREPKIDSLNEDLHWFYCKDTNTKLFPLSLYRLAQTFTSGGDYQSMLEIVCADVGTESDDGDAIVDKHSGYVLRKKDLSTEEGYDDTGRKLVTRDIIEKDLGVIHEENKKKTRIFENETSEKLHNILLSIASNIDIPIDSIEDSILRLSIEIMNKNIISESKYATKSEQYFNKTGKKLGSYEKYKNESMLIILGSLLLISIQTAVPSFQTKKTFPSCVRSFSGYPLSGMEDTTGIQYIACVLIKMKSAIPPWDSLRNVKQEVLSNRMKDIIEKYIVPLNEIQEMYITKKEYISLHPENIAPEEHKVQKWLTFLPPVVETKVIPGLKNVSSEFKRDLLEKVKKGDVKQDESINMLKSKNILHGFAVMESINGIVKNKDLLLKTSSKIPFTENACCNEDVNLNNPLIYFNEEDPNIKQYLQRVAKNQKTIKDIRILSSARMFYHDESTSISYPKLPSDYMEENIYHAFIHYCNFDKDLPIPEKLKDICGELSTSYNKKANLEEKIDFLKRNGKRFTIHQLHNMMSIINKENMVQIHSRDVFHQVDAFKDMIETLELNNSELFDEPLRNLLRKVAQKYEPLKMVDTPSDELNDLTDYLILANRKLFKNITVFLDESNMITDSTFNKLVKFLATAHEWSRETDDKNIDGINMHNSFLFIQNAIMSIGKIYPELLSNNADFNKVVCKHWGFSEKHEDDIELFLTKFYKPIEKFKGDKVIINLLNSVKLKIIDMNVFIQSIPLYTEIQKTMTNQDDEEVKVSFHSLFNQVTYYEIMKYCLYRTLYEFILCSDDTDLLRTEVVEMRLERQERNNIIDDPTEGIESVRLSVNETHDTVLNELEETDIRADSSDELKTRVATLLQSFLEIEMDNKSSTDYTYEEIIKKVTRSKQREKKSIIDYLGNMSKEERKVEELFKMYKLGRWNVGNQKGLISYDKETYERERNELLTQLQDDETNKQYEQVSEMRREIFDLEKDDETAQDEFYQQEANDISQLDEDYMDGNFYPEDVEDYNE